MDFSSTKIAKTHHCPSEPFSLSKLKSFSMLSLLLYCCSCCLEYTKMVVFCSASPFLNMGGGGCKVTVTDMTDG